jgi:hypothetical protein
MTTFNVPRVLAWFFLFLLPAGVTAQQRVVVSGFIEDAASGESLVNATIHAVDGRATAITNAYGFFSLTLPAGAYRFVASHVGYAAVEIRLQPRRDTMIRVALRPGLQLEEVTVRPATVPVTLAATGKHVLPARQLRVMPALLGESDLLKSIQMLPGVNPGTEGMSGASVRGSSPEQTLVLLDGMPVYNVNHAFGFISVFNGEALKEVTLLKGGIPARHGGRLSSVLDVTMKEGNSRALAGSLSISPIAGSLTVEGPVVKEKASFILSARRTWLDGLLRVGQSLVDGGATTRYNFYDLNAKVNWKASDRHRLFLSFYNGRDGFGATWDDGSRPGRHIYSWGNASVAGRWNWIVSPRLFNNTTLYYTRFKYTNEARQHGDGEVPGGTTRYSSILEEVTLKSDFDLVPDDRRRARFGIALSRSYLAPETASRSLATTGATWYDATAGRYTLLEGYVEEEARVGTRWHANLGARGTLLFTGNARHASIEPRASIALLVAGNTSLKASFSMMQQPLHLLANSSMAWTTDMWVPVSDKVKPARSRLYSLGASHVTASGIELSVELYYNRLLRTIRYRDGIHFLKQKDESWQEYIHVGEGRARGVEFMAARPAGNLNGWVAYTLSRSERRFSGIAGNAWFPFEYDRPHKVNAVANYTFTPRAGARYRKVLALNFTYASGNYTTIGDETHAGLPLPWEDPELGSWARAQESSSRPNNARLPAYHHLDVVLHLQNRSGKGGSWSLGVYNLYARQNPTFYYRQWESLTSFAYKKVSLLPFAPIVSWNYKF